MTGEAIRLARYRFSATFRRMWPGYLSLALLIGLVGGLAIGSIAGARRTDSSFTAFWKSTNPSDLSGITGILNPSLPFSPYDGPLVSKISHLPHVKRVETQSGINILPLQPDGAPEQNVTEFSPGPGNGYGSVDGLYFNQDRVTVTAGQMADPAAPDQFMLTAAQAQSMGLRVGDKVRFGIYTNAQIQLADFGSARVRPYRVVEATLVGIVAFNSSVVQDQADEGSAPDNLFTPALTRPMLRCCVNYSESGVQVTNPRFDSVVISEINKFYPKGAPAFQVVAPTVLPKAQRAIEPEALALGVFGGIVAIACLLIAAQLIGRQNPPGRRRKTGAPSPRGQPRADLGRRHDRLSGQRGVGRPARSRSWGQPFTDCSHRARAPGLPRGGPELRLDSTRARAARPCPGAERHIRRNQLSLGPATVH